MMSKYFGLSSDFHTTHETVQKKLDECHVRLNDALKNIGKHIHQKNYDILEDILSYIEDRCTDVCVDERKHTNLIFDLFDFIQNPDSYTKKTKAFHSILSYIDFCCKLNMFCDAESIATEIMCKYFECGVEEDSDVKRVTSHKKNNVKQQRKRMSKRVEIPPTPKFFEIDNMECHFRTVETVEDLESDGNEYLYCSMTIPEIPPPLGL